MRFAFAILPVAILCAAPICFAPVCYGQDARSIVTRAVAAWDHNDRLMLDYTYKVRDEIRELDAKGKVKSDHSTLDEVLYIGGKRYFKPLERDGEPLPAGKEKSEEAKLERAAREAGRLSEEEHQQRVDEAERDRLKRREQFRDVPGAYDFKLLGETPIEGRRTWEILATPRPGYRGKFGGLFRNIEGKLWIDEQDYEWTKVEAEVLDNFSLGWFLARVDKGTHISFAMTRVNDEIWAPGHFSLTASARIALMKKINAEQDVTFSDYRKFSADARIVASGDAP
jgi:hypothetical protein